MSNITEVFWEANGLSLHTHAWAVETKAGRQVSAAKRGEDVKVPFRPGRRRVAKVRESRTLSLPMWVRPVNQDGSEDNSMSAEAKVDQNWAHIMASVDIEQQFPLVKRWYVNGVIQQATAMAELLDPPEIAIVTKNTWRFTLELFLADPWFYGPEISQPVGAIDVLGNAPTTHVTLDMGAGRVTTPDGNWIEYTGSGTVVIDCHDAVAKRGTDFVNGLIERNPKFPEWVMLYPGVNSLTGSGTISYEPAYK